MLDAGEYVKNILLRRTKRDMQKRVGASNISTACTRCLADDLLGIERPQSVYDMGAIVGTAIHDYLDKRNQDDTAYKERKVVLGSIEGYGEIKSTTDLYIESDRHVIDFKGLALDTPLPTPTGWTTMGDVQVGDYLLDETGKPTRVTGKSDVKHLRGYRLRFKDGTEVVCDHEHLWAYGYAGDKYTTTPADELYEHSKDSRKPWISNADALNLPEQELPIDPYVLGVWLGDGDSVSMGLSLGEKKAGVLSEFRKRGVTLVEQKAKNRVSNYAFTHQGFSEKFRELNLYKNKHIPELYLRSSYQQRLDLLRGIMDTDGYYNPVRRRAVMTTTSRWQANGVADLVRTLGWNCTPHAYTTSWTHGGEKKHKQAYLVEFTPTVNVFLARNQDVPVAGTVSSRRKLLVSMEPLDEVVTQCVMVDSPTHMYLCTKNYLPTHNTTTRDKLKYYIRSEQQEPTEYEITSVTHARDTINQYFRQANLYALGLEREGFLPEYVSIVFVCRDGQIVDRDVYGITRVYDKTLALQTLARTEELWKWLHTDGNDINDLPSQEDCFFCENVRTSVPSHIVL